MTGRERVLAAMRRRPPDRVPFDLSFDIAPAQLDEFRRRTGSTLTPEEYFGTDTRMIRLGPTRLAQDYAAWLGPGVAGAAVDEWGVGRRPTRSADRAHVHLDGFIHPLAGVRNAAGMADYPFPDIDADYRYDAPRAAIRAVQEAGRAAVAMMECTIFETAWFLRGMEALLLDFADGSEAARALLDAITARRVVQARRYAELGADVLSMGDDVGTQRGMLMSVGMWRAWLKPRLARVIAAAREVRPDVLVFYHSDGNMAAIIPDLIEIGVDILNPVQPECMDPADLKRRFGDRLSFWGLIGTQSTLPFGTPADVAADVRLRVRTVGAGGGLFLAPTHVIEPEVPFENIVAFVDAVKATGPATVPGASSPAAR
jgi:uroporphyrinogen decarboxylase